MSSDSPVYKRQWTDPDGVVWSRRGEGDTTFKRARILLLDPAVRVVLFGGPELVEVDQADRSSLWGRIEPYLSGRIDRSGQRATNDVYEVRVVELRNPDGQALLAVHEYC